MLDLLIKGGLVIDGTGSPGYFAAVGVEGDTLRIIRSDASEVEAAETIDATGKVVCPGFIDLHAHTGLTILGEPRHEPKVRQGLLRSWWALTAYPTPLLRPRKNCTAISGWTPD